VVGYLLLSYEDQYQDPTDKAMLGFYKELGMGPTLKTTHQHQANVFEGKLVRPSTEDIPEAGQSSQEFSTIRPDRVVREEGEAGAGVIPGLKGPACPIEQSIIGPISWNEF